MSTTDKTQIDALLVEVMRKPEDEREAFLDLVCRDDDNLDSLVRTPVWAGC